MERPGRRAAPSTFWWVHGTSDHDVWAVGTSGRIAHWDGATFTAHASGTTATLYGVWAAATDACGSSAARPAAGRRSRTTCCCTTTGRPSRHRRCPDAGAHVLQGLGHVVGQPLRRRRIRHHLAPHGHDLGARGEQPPLATGNLTTVNGCSATDVYAVGGHDVLPATARRGRAPTSRSRTASTASRAARRARRHRRLRRARSGSWRAPGSTTPDEPHQTTSTAPGPTRPADSGRPGGHFVDTGGGRVRARGPRVLRDRDRRLDDEVARVSEVDEDVMSRTPTQPRSSVSSRSASSPRRPGRRGHPERAARRCGRHPEPTPASGSLWMPTTTAVGGGDDADDQRGNRGTRLLGPLAHDVLVDLRPRYGSTVDRTLPLPKCASVPAHGAPATASLTKSPPTAQKPPAGSAHAPWRSWCGSSAKSLTHVPPTSRCLQSAEADDDDVPGRGARHAVDAVLEGHVRAVPARPSADEHVLPAHGVDLGRAAAVDRRQVPVASGGSFASSAHVVPVRCQMVPIRRRRTGCPSPSPTP